MVPLASPAGHVGSLTQSLEAPSFAGTATSGLGSRYGTFDPLAKLNRRQSGKGAVPQLSLTDFVDIALRAGTPKLTKVREIKRRPEYDPSTDFWRALRSKIIEAHEHGHGPSHLSKSMMGLADQKKKTAYPPLVEAYRKWWGRKEHEWFKPPTGAWSSGSVSVNVNPELGLRIDGRETVIKLYFKADKLSKNRIDVILYLMQETLGADAPDATMGIMDVRNSKLFVPTVPIPDLGAMLRGEAAFIASVWDNID